MLSKADAYALKRKFSKMDVPSDLKLSPVISAIVTNITDDSLLMPIMMSLGQDIMNQIMQVDPDKPPIEEKKKEHFHVPKLADYALLSEQNIEEAKRAGAWLDECMSWLNARSPMTPPNLLESGALWAAGLTVAGRAQLHLDFADITPNLYVAWVAASSVFKKTTGLGAIDDLMRKTAPHLLMASSTTPETIIFKASGKKPTNFDELPEEQRLLEEIGIRHAAQRGSIIDEISSLFSTKEYQKGLRELMMQMFGGTKTVSGENKKDGLMIAQYPSLSILGATTETRLALIDDEAWGDGILARFALITPPPDTEIKKIRVTTDRKSYAPPANILTSLIGLNRSLAVFTPEHPKEIVIDSKALDLANKYKFAIDELTIESEERMAGTYGRMFVLALKVASILASMDYIGAGADKNKAIVIYAGHWARAQMIVESWRYSAHHTLSKVSKSADELHQDAIISVLERIATEDAGGITKSDLMRATHLKSRDIEPALAALIESGQVQGLEPSGRQRGLRYSLVRD